ncbi:MAG: hypothetical protein JWO67_4034 [Streptosporangiaceae bacterium]|nr:hypothetical protein [Streptosporangiaceae bacterium]
MVREEILYEEIGYRIEVLRHTQQGWIPVVATAAKYRLGEHWYTDAGQAGKDAQRLWKQLPSADVRVIRKVVTLETTGL